MPRPSPVASDGSGTRRGGLLERHVWNHRHPGKGPEAGRGRPSGVDPHDGHPEAPGAGLLGSPPRDRLHARQHPTPGERPVPARRHAAVERGRLRDPHLQRRGHQLPGPVEAVPARRAVLAALGGRHRDPPAPVRADTCA